MTEEEKKIECLFPADELLSREPIPGYVENWTNAVKKTKNESSDFHELSLLLFRLGNEWFGISTHVFSQVCELKLVHRIPHNRSELLKGLVNISGQLRICVALDKLLEIGSQSDGTKRINPVVYDRMIVTEYKGECWVFPADEVYGIYRTDKNFLENPPITLSKSSTNFLRGVISWGDYHVGYLDEELIFYSIKRNVLT